jgi:hypothetical protein
MAEFAMVAPFFFLLLFGIIEAGRFVFYYEMVNSATREGARYAIVHGYNNPDCPSGPPAPNSFACDVPGDNVKEAVRKAAIGLVGVGDFVALEAWWCKAGAPKPCAPEDRLTNFRGNPVTVRAVYQYSPVMPLLPPITFSAESTLVINN